MDTVFRSAFDDCGNESGEGMNEETEPGAETVSNNWLQLNDGNMFTSTGKTVKEIPPALYSIDYNGTYGIVFRKEEAVCDEMIIEHNSQINHIVTEVENFWNSGEKYYNNGFMHRRGILMYGKQGCGKSMLINYLIKKSIQEHNCIALLCDYPPYRLSKALNDIKDLEKKERKIICIFEDIDSLCKDTEDENRLLSILDGETQIDKVLNIATTNYLDKLNPRIKRRPRRFGKRLEVYPPEKDVRKAFFQSKHNFSEEEAEKWADETEDLTYASLAELVVSVNCLDYGFRDTVERLRELEETQRKAGFGK